MNRREIKFLVMAGLLHLALPVAAAVVPRPATTVTPYVEMAPVQRVVDIDVSMSIPLRAEPRPLDPARWVEGARLCPKRNAHAYVDVDYALNRCHLHIGCDRGGGARNDSGSNRECEMQ